MTNKYKSPTEWGYKEVKITKGEFKEIFGKRLGVRNKAVVFAKDTANGRKWHCEVYVSRIGIAIALLCYPITVLMEGFSNIKSLNKIYSGLFDQKERGGFYTMNKN